MKRLTLGILLLCGVFACSSGEGGGGIIEPAKKYTVQGTVQDSAAGKPVSNVTVSIDGKTATTDFLGAYQIADVASGNQTLTVTGSAFEPFTRQLNVSANSTVNVPLRRLAPYLLSFNLAGSGSSTIVVTFLDLQSIDAVGATLRITGPGYTDVSALPPAAKTVLSSTTVRLQYNTSRTAIQTVTFFATDGQGHQATFACGTSSPCTEQ